MTNAALLIAVTILAAFIYWLTQHLGLLEIVGLFLGIIAARR